MSAHKACGPDGLSARILSECADEFAVPLGIICRISATSGVFPTVWKRAHVIPVRKKGSKKLPENYRPVSLFVAFVYLLKSLREGGVRELASRLSPRTA